MSARGCLVLFLFTIAGIVILALGKHIPYFAGPYTIHIRLLTNTSDEFTSSGKIWSRLYFTHPRPKQLQYTWGQIYSSVPFTNKQKVEVRVSSRSNNEWKRNAFVMRFPNFCDSSLKHSKFIWDLMYGAPRERRCPVPTIGLRQIQNQTINPVFPHFPVMPYGRYLLTIATIDEIGKTIGVMSVDLDVVPKL